MADTTSSTTAAVTVAETLPEHVTVSVVASGPAVAPEVAKEPASSDTKRAAAEPVAPTSNPGPAKAAKEDGGGSFQRQGDDFYNTIFYFSGMGSVIGSALSQGVYVSEQNRRNAIDPDDVSKKGQQTEQLVVSARGQAQNLSTDFHKLQSLLDSLPIFTGSGGSTAAAADRRNELDQPIHGELYFRCKERFPVQPSPTPMSGSSSGRYREEPVMERPRSRQLEPDTRSRRRHDDSVLDEVARAAVDAFPLLPPPRGLGSSPGSSGRASRDRDGGAISPAVPRGERRRPQPSSDWNQQDAAVDVRPWQMSHVRQYDVMDGYPINRP